MIVSTNLEFTGNCQEAIAFYRSIFEDAQVKVQSYHDMPMASVFGISDERLDMVWKASLTITFGQYTLRLDLADSLFAAMNHAHGNQEFAYNPLVQIVHPNEDVVHGLVDKLSGGKVTYITNKGNEVADKYGIRWSFVQANEAGIFSCFEFNGFCSQVVDYYQLAFQPEISIQRYENSEKILCALLAFKEEGYTYALKLNDDQISAQHNQNSYDPTALLFYQGVYNPVLNVRISEYEALSRAFAELSKGAKLNKDLTKDDSGAVSGSMIDRFGICWSFS